MFRLTIRNLTDQSITALAPSAPDKAQKCKAHKLRKRNTKDHAVSECFDVLLEPRVDFSTAFWKRFCNGVVLKVGKNVQGDQDGPGYNVQISMPPAAIWRSVAVPEDCPWRIYIVQVNIKHRQVMILESRNLASFMAELPDRLPLSSLSLPGSHNTMAFYGWPISQCQVVPLVNQLLGGIRVIDIRLAVVPHPDAPKGPVKSTVTPELVAYHGWWPQQTPFLAILNDVYQFLSSPAGQSETIIMSIKQEDAEVTSPPVFSQMVRDAIVHGPGGGRAGNDSNATSGSGSVNQGMWFLENRIPSLGEVRGKVVLFSRFGGDGAAWPERLEGIGIHPTTWPDNKKEGFEWDSKGTRVRTHDWYGIPSVFSIPEKFKLGTMNLLPPTLDSTQQQPFLPITYFSAASFPFALPPIVAKGFGWPDWGLGVYGINTLLGRWLLEQMGDTNTVLEGPKIRGWTLMDYYSEPSESQVVPLLVECNFLGRRNGEEGW